MFRPKLSDFSAFVEKPKPVKIITKYDIQQNINFYMNLVLFLIILLGCLVLYYRGKYKLDREKQAKETITKFENYMNDYIISDMLDKQNNNIPY